MALTNALCDPDRRGEAKAGLCSFARSGALTNFIQCPQHGMEHVQQRTWFVVGRLYLVAGHYSNVPKPNQTSNNEPGSLLDVLSENDGGQLGHQVRLTARGPKSPWLSPRPMEMTALWDLTRSSTVWLPPVKLFLKSDKAAKSLRKWTKQTLAGLDLTPCCQVSFECNCRQSDLERQCGPACRPLLGKVCR